MIRFWKTLLAAALLVCSSAVLAVTDETVNINSADAETLARVLKGVGVSRAEAIVAYRTEHGEFLDPYELVNVKGIGERTVDMNAERILLED